MIHVYILLFHILISLLLIEIDCFSFLLLTFVSFFQHCWICLRDQIALFVTHSTTDEEAHKLRNVWLKV